MSGDDKWWEFNYATMSSTMLSQRKAAEAASAQNQAAALAQMQSPQLQSIQQVAQMQQDALSRFYFEDALTPAPAAEPARSEEETKSAFAALMLGSGVKKTLTIQQKVLHEVRLGELAGYEAAKEPDNKRLCGICGDPLCPWSD